MSEPTKFHRTFHLSRKRGKLCMPPLSRDSPLAPFPASGLPAKAPRLLPAMMPALTAVSFVAGARTGRFGSATRRPKLPGYMAPQLSDHVLDSGKKASETSEAGT